MPFVLHSVQPNNTVRQKESMFRETEFSYLLIPALSAAAIFTFFAHVKVSREKDPRKKLTMRIRFALWTAGGFLLYLWFLLQWYNREIVRTVEILHWAIFLGVFLVGASIEAALREFRGNDGVALGSTDKK